MELVIGIAGFVAGGVFGYCMGWFDRKGGER